MKTFEHTRPIRDDKGEVTGERPAPVWRKTVRDALGTHHGTDRGRRLAVGLVSGDLISVRPAGTRREPLTILASDLYDLLVRRAANLVNLKKARERKEARAVRLARQRQERAEKRLLRPI